MSTFLTCLLNEIIVQYLNSLYYSWYFGPYYRTNVYKTLSTIGGCVNPRNVGKNYLNF